MDPTDEIKGGAYTLEAWDSPGIVIPKKFRGPILHWSSGRIKRSEPTVTFRCSCYGADEFPLVSETLGWWYKHRAQVLIVEGNPPGRSKLIGRYHIDALDKDNDKFVWEATFRIIDRFDYGNRLNLTATMQKAWTEEFYRWAVRSIAEISVSSDYNSVTFTVCTNSAPSATFHIKTIFNGPDTSGLYESIGRIEMVLRELEGEICLSLGHIPSLTTDCPQEFTLGKHCRYLRKAHTNCSCPASELHSELESVIRLVEDKILAWRNGFAHGLLSFDAPVVRNSGLGDFDEKTNTFTSSENVPQPLLFIRHKEKNLELTPETLIQIEKEIIDAWSIIKLFNMKKYAK